VENKEYWDAMDTVFLDIDAMVFMVLLDQDEQKPYIRVT
jgi:hypothetical protein